MHPLNPPGLPLSYYYGGLIGYGDTPGPRQEVSNTSFSGFFPVSAFHTFSFATGDLNRETPDLEILLSKPGFYRIGDTG
jgi:hypothetical protein